MIQHDDHIWLTVGGVAWAIQAILPPVIYLWRGYWPDCKYSAVDMSEFNYDDYCTKAVRMLEETNK